MSTETEAPAPDFSFRPLGTIASTVARENDIWMTLAGSWGHLPFPVPPVPVIIPDEQRAEWDRLESGHADAAELPQRKPADSDGMPQGWAEIHEELSQLPGADEPMPAKDVPRPGTGNVSATQQRPAGIEAGPGPGHSVPLDDDAQADKHAEHFGAPDEAFWADEKPRVIPPPETTEMTAILPVPSEGDRQ